MELGGGGITPIIKNYTGSGTGKKGDVVNLVKGGGVTVDKVFNDVVQNFSASQFTGKSNSICVGAFDPVNNKYVFFYLNASNYLTGIVGTLGIDGSFTYGTPVVIDGVACNEQMDCIYDVTTGNIIVAYQKTSDNYTRIIVTTVSGTSITFGTAVVVESVASSTGISFSVNLAYISDDSRYVVTYTTATPACKATLFTISGTVPTIGNSYTTSSGAGSKAFNAVYNTVKKCVLFAMYDTTSKIRMGIWTASGGVLTNVNNYTVNSGITVHASLDFNTTTGQVCYVFNETGGTISAYTILDIINTRFDVSVIGNLTNLYTTANGTGQSIVKYIPSRDEFIVSNNFSGTTSRNLVILSKSPSNSQINQGSTTNIPGTIVSQSTYVINRYLRIQDGTYGNILLNKYNDAVLILLNFNSVNYGILRYNTAISMFGIAQADFTNNTSVAVRLFQRGDIDSSLTTAMIGGVYFNGKGIGIEAGKILLTKGIEI